MINYLIAVGIAIISSVVLFFTLREYKKARIGIIVAIWVILVIFIGIKTILEKPIIFLNGNKNISIDVYENYEEMGARATYRLNDLTDEVIVDGIVDTSVVGTYKVTYTISKDDKIVSEERIVNIVDKIPPEITLDGIPKVIASSINMYEEAGFKAIDNYDKDITDKVQVETIKINDNHYKKIYTVSDSSGNTAKVERDVEVKDIVAPTITLNGSAITNVKKGKNYEDAGATAIDDLEGDVSSTITKEGEVDTNTLGTYTITYYAKDSSGNIGTATRKVQVVEKEKKGEVYLTFDDGPSLGITPQILDILKEEGVPATFFILNYNDAEEYLVKRIVDEGHTIAIHGYSHDYDYIYSSDDICMNNITRLHDKILASTGVDTRIIRFPGGSSNTISDFNPGIMQRMTQRVLNEGYHYFDWNVSSGDAGGAETVGEVYQNVTWTLKEGRRNVVLMHDFSGNYKTLNALKGIIDFCKEERI